MKKWAMLCVLLLLSVYAHGQEVGVKTNLLYWATTTPNIGIEFKTSQKTTLSLSTGINMFEFPSRTAQDGMKINPKIKHWLVMPEFKYWFCKAFERANIGIHAIYADYNVGGISFIPALKDHRYRGNLYGGGISAGYQWAIGGRFGLELSAGVGFIHLDYSKYECQQCGELVKKDSRNYVGPTKAAISLIYFIR